MKFRKNEKKIYKFLIFEYMIKHILNTTTE